MRTPGDTQGGPTLALLARARAGDRAARERVLRMMMPTAERVARRFAGPQHPVEDLTQIAGIGLLKAIDRFDPKRDATFRTYAHALMTGEVRRNLRDSRMVRIPRAIYEQVPVFHRTLGKLRHELGRDPSRDEVAQAMGITREDVVELIDAATSSQHVSLDAAAEEAGGELQLTDDDGAFAQAEAGVDLKPMLARLTARERMILELRFTDGLSQSEIGRGLGLSQTQVSRLIRAALTKLSDHAQAAAA